MKRLFAFGMLVSLLLSGCCFTVPAPENPVTPPAQTQATTAAAEETVPSTEPAPTEPVPTEPELVTFYLLEKSAIYDSGYTKYLYDDNYNILSSATFTIENDPFYSNFYENQDANGMPCQIRTVWPGSSNSESVVLEYFPDGRIREEMYVGSEYTGFQFEYDQNGNMTQKREYYMGQLFNAVYYSYNGNEPIRIYSENGDSQMVYDCVIENGRIFEKVCYDYESPYSYFYEYDQNGCLTRQTILIDGEESPVIEYTYKAVEVDVSRVPYLQVQQDLLISLT